jgi:hypothetical protein
MNEDIQGDSRMVSDLFTKVQRLSCKSTSLSLNATQNTFRNGN